MEGSDTEASASLLETHCPRMECILSLGIHQHRPLLPECPVLTALETALTAPPASTTKPRQSQVWGHWLPAARGGFVTQMGHLAA